MTKKPGPRSYDAPGACTCVGCPRIVVVVTEPSPPPRSLVLPIGGSAQNGRMVAPMSTVCSCSVERDPGKVISGFVCELRIKLAAGMLCTTSEAKAKHTAIIGELILRRGGANVPLFVKWLLLPVLLYIRHLMADKSGGAVTPSPNSVMFVR